MDNPRRCDVIIMPSLCQPGLLFSVTDPVGWRKVFPLPLRFSRSFRDESAAQLIFITPFKSIAIKFASGVPTAIVEITMENAFSSCLQVLGRSVWSAMAAEMKKF